MDAATITMITDLCDNLLNATEVENIDLPLVSLLTDRLLEGALSKEDLEYLLTQERLHLYTETYRLLISL